VSTAHHIVRTAAYDLLTSRLAGEPTVVSWGVPQQWTDLTFTSAGPFEWIWFGDSDGTIEPEAMHALTASTPQRIVETMSMTLGVGTVRLGDRDPRDADAPAAELFDLVGLVLREDPDLGVDVDGVGLTYLAVTLSDWEHNSLPLGNRQGWGSLYSIGLDVATGHD